jgi:ADP-ribosyl-[dinitrogen reductase] hydrolase
VNAELVVATEGSCLCGAVRYEIDRLASPIGFCHCLTCQKAHAAASAPTARVRREHFRWLLGRESVAGYESSPGKIRHFCKRCGSHIVSEKSGLDEFILRVATLDSDPGMRPVVHIWTSHDVPWLEEVDLPKLAEGFSST